MADLEETKTEETKTSTKKDKRVSVFIPRGAEKDEPNLFVAVNGKSYLLPKGKESKVPVEVAEEINRANRAQENLYSRKDAMQDEMLAAQKNVARLTQIN